ncbi:MAG TPA: DUF881 domain-containing protein [Symbiobacteriaceae bacterium]|nr:DUF881 domain-containing protein [Symbiobacteriaceae bacterium]
MSPKRYLAPAMICLVLGLALVLQVRTQQRKVREAALSVRVSESMVEQLIAVSKEREKLLEEQRYLRGLASQQATQAQLQEELAVELSAAGLVEMRGPGVNVTMGGTAANPRDLTRVEPSDVISMLNELKAAGAEAVAVGGMRVTDRLTITRGPHRSILINGQAVAGPISIQAIGDPAVLEASLNLRGGVVATYRVFYPVTVTVAPTLVIPAAEQPPAYIHAIPVS